ncbi:MAG: ABC transporter ATP-binding protein [bacterium]
MTDAAFSLTSASKGYDVWRRLRRTRARGVDGVTLAVPRGCVFALLGLNGAGKTTAMRLLVGLLRPDRGTVRVLGGDPAADPAIRARIGYLPELPYLPRQMTGRALLRHYGRMSGLAGRPLSNRVERALELTGIRERAGDPLHLCSKGQVQRVAMAQALLHEPDVLFLDEPLSGLDPRGIAEMRDLIARLKAAGATVCVNSHQIAEVERICDRAGILAEGRLAAEGSLGELRARSPAGSLEDAVLRAAGVARP